MGENDLTFCSSFRNSLFNNLKKKFELLFMSQICTRLIYISQPGTKVPRVAKHGTEVMKQILCFDCLNIYFVSTLATLLPVKSNGYNAWAFIRAFMVVCIFNKGVKGQCLSFTLVPSFVF